MIGTDHRNLSATASGETQPPNSVNPLTPLLNLSHLSQKMNSLRSVLSDSLNHQISLNDHHLHLISGEIISAVHQLITNASALLPDSEIVEIDARELISERAHFCSICRKSFKRDANLRMHMRAHGDQFKTPQFLSKTNSPSASRSVKFSCPFVSCIRNKTHPNFRPLKTSVCVRNHFRRSHCPKLYGCDLCGKKSFSVAADLRSHRKSCEELRWKCSCGTSFCRKDKLFGHVALFEGHFPVVEDCGVKEERLEGLDEGFFDGLMEEIGGMVGF